MYQNVKTHIGSWYGMKERWLRIEKKKTNHITELFCMHKSHPSSYKHVNALSDEVSCNRLNFFCIAVISFFFCTLHKRAII